MKFNTRLVSASVGLTLLAAAMPSGALAKSAAIAPASTPQLTIKAPVVSAQDAGSDKPKVQGWQTGEGDMTDGDCEHLANNISQELDWASTDLESGDLDQMFHDLSRAEEMEDQAEDGGCALSYPA